MISVNKVIYENIIKMVPQENVLLAEPMNLHTTFRVGGEADALIRISKPDELALLLPYFRKLDQAYFILGNGSNLLVSDKGYRGVILQVGELMSQITVSENRILAQSGALLSRVANTAMENGLTGMEFASGIPGTIGGAVVMNAGAYDGEMKQIVSGVSVLDRDGNCMNLGNRDMEFGYRSSVIKNKSFAVTEVSLCLQNGDRETVKEKMRDFAERRREKQPLTMPSAGSTFKRPQGSYAGKLIMDAGLRGFRIGGAQVSEKHCGFVINLGNATAADIYELMEEIKARVYGQFGIMLEPEVIRLGEF